VQIDLDLKTMLADAETLYRRIEERNRSNLSELPVLLDEAEYLFRSVAQRRAKRRDSEAKQFNIFTLTHRAAYEVTTHQAIIRDLVDPAGTHEQGNLFLEPFLELVTARSGIALPPPDGLWRAEKGLAYIDVRLHQSYTHHSVIIETKWDARDRVGQVLEYWNSERTRTGKTRVPVVFLTKDGRPPELGPETSNHAQFRPDLICIAFRSEFAELLRRTLKQVESARVRETLRQYLDLLVTQITDDDGVNVG
jgi:hypothetical protein